MHNWVPSPSRCLRIVTQLVFSHNLTTSERNYGSSSQTHKYYKLKERQQHACSVPTVGNSRHWRLYLSHTQSWVSSFTAHLPHCVCEPRSPFANISPVDSFPLWTLPSMSRLNPLAKGHCTKTALWDDWTEQERKDLIILQHDTALLQISQLCCGHRFDSFNKKKQKKNKSNWSFWLYAL